VDQFHQVVARNTVLLGDFPDRRKPFILDAEINQNPQDTCKSDIAITSRNSSSFWVEFPKTQTAPYSGVAIAKGDSNQPESALERIVIDRTHDQLRESARH
jgi:hypothetical protein